MVPEVSRGCCSLALASPIGEWLEPVRRSCRSMASRAPEVAVAEGGWKESRPAILLGDEAGVDDLGPGWRDEAAPAGDLDLDLLLCFDLARVFFPAEAAAPC